MRGIHPVFMSSCRNLNILILFRVATNHLRPLSRLMEKWSLKLKEILELENGLSMQGPTLLSHCLVGLMRTRMKLCRGLDRRSLSCSDIVSEFPPMLPDCPKTEQLIPDSFHLFIGKNLLGQPFSMDDIALSQNPTATCDLELANGYSQFTVCSPHAVGGCG